MDIKIWSATYVNPYQGYNAGYSIPDVDDKLTNSLGADAEDNEVLGIGFLPSDSDGVSYGTAKVNALNSFINRIKTETQAPYSHLADESGNITYNGVIFNCNNEKQAICLGDVSDMDNVLTIPLSGGGCLMVNRDNIDSLAKAIGMFSPEDMGIIMRAIAQDNQLKGNLKEIEDIKDGDFHSSVNYKKTWETSFKGAAQGVEDAWNSAMEDTGIDGFGFDKEGKLTHIPQILVARLTKDSGMPVFGNTVESALRFAEKALSELNIRLKNSTDNEETVSAKEDEKQFYQVFIDKLKAQL